MGEAKSLDEKTIEMLREKEPRILEALARLYSSYVVGERPLTIRESTYGLRVTSPDLTYYMHWKTELELGMPDGKEDAEQYLRRVQDYLSSLRS